MNRKVLSTVLILAMTFSLLASIPYVLGVPNPSHVFVATFGGVETVDPGWAYDTASGEIIQNIYEPLCAFNLTSTAEYIGKVADTWPGYGVNYGNAITPSPPHPLAPGEGARHPTTETWYFHIREGVKWHDWETLVSKTVTPFDVEYSIERGMMMDHTGGPQWMLFDPLLETYYGGSADWDFDGDGDINATEYLMLEWDVTHAIEANATHVWFNLPGPYAPFQQIICQSWGMILSKEYAVAHGAWTQEYGNYAEFLRTHDPPAPGPLMQDAGGNTAWEAMGCGPFKLAAYNPDPHTGFWTVEAFADYYGGWPAPAYMVEGPDGNPAGGSVQYATVKLVEEWANRKAQFFSTDPNLQADFCAVPRPNVPEMHIGGDKDGPTYPGFRLTKPLTPAVSLASLFFNYFIQTPSDFVPKLGATDKTDLLSDRDLRLAIIYCMNVTQFIDEYWLGEAVQPTTCMPPGRAYYNDTKPKYNIDLTKAQYHFEKAWCGDVWDQGITLKVTYNEGNTARETVAKMVEDVIEHRIPWPESAVVDIIPTGIPWSTYIVNMFTGTLPCFTLGWLEDYPDPHNWFSPYMASAGDFSGVAQNVQYGLARPCETTIEENWHPTNKSYGPPPYTNILGEYVPEINNTYVDHMLGVAIGALSDVRKEIYQEMMDVFYAEAISLTIYNALTRHYERTWINGYEGTWNHNPIAPGLYFYTMWKATVATVYSVDISATDTITNVTTAHPKIQNYRGEMRLNGKPANITYDISVSYLDETGPDIYVLVALKRTDTTGDYYFPIGYPISMSPGETYEETWVWYENGTEIGMPLGSGIIEEGEWTISLYASPSGVPGGEVEDSNLANNIADHTQIVETNDYIVDITGDGKVRVDDVLKCALAFGSAPGHDRWDPYCDVTGDNKVRVDDVLKVALAFGTSYP